MHRIVAPLALALLGACAAPALSPSTAESGVTAVKRPPALPDRDGPTPWGGVDASRWRPEAVIANAASTALNEAWRDPATRDAVVAIPLAMLGSELFPYGDGQSNAAPSLRGWPVTDRPPVVATLIRRDDEQVRVALRLDRALPTSAEAVVVRWRVAGQLATARVPISVDASGDRVGTWSPPADLELGDPLTTSSFAVAPEGWRGGFGVSFVQPVRTASSLAAASARFSDGALLLDRERVGVGREDGRRTGSVRERLRAHHFAARYNHQGPGPVVPYATPDVHAAFPWDGRLVRTGVGGGLTWVADERPAGYKVMLQCFDARRQEDEAGPEGGVPSGSGWHRIGDRAETVVNDLEEAPMLVGYAARDVIAPWDAGVDGFAWNLSDVATFRWLMPGEAMVAPRGAFHWFGFSHDAPTCAEVIVSPEHASLADFEP